MDITVSQLAKWLLRYFEAWVSNDPVEVAALFSEDAVYYYDPFKEPSKGRRVIVEKWVSDPEGQRDITTSFDVLAVEGNLGVAHWNVKYLAGPSETQRVEMDGILLLRFNPKMECTEHREWYSYREVES